LYYLILLFHLQKLYSVELNGKTVKKISYLKAAILTCDKANSSTRLKG